MHRLIVVLLLLAPLSAGAADLGSPIGVWRTVDDRTGEQRSDVRIYEADGKLYGKVVRIFDPTEAGQLCLKCTDDRRNQPVMGMIIMRGLSADGDAWTGGRIVDPETGSVYHCRMHLTDGGQELVLRGFVMLPMMGRTQTWLREPDA